MRTFQGCVKREASRPHEEVANEADEENRIMTMFSTALEAQISKVQEEHVGEGIDNLGSIWCSIIVLHNGQQLVLITD